MRADVLQGREAAVVLRRLTDREPRISVIVPTLDEARYIEACLHAIQDSETVETIVVDGGSTDDTVQRAATLAATVIVAPRGRGAQMNAGARLAHGDVLLFVHADSVLPRGWRVGIATALHDPRVVGGTFRLRFDRDTALLRFYAWFTRFEWRVFHYGDQGIFVRRHVFEALGGFIEQPLMEDVDFLARLRRAGRTVLCPLDVITSARRFERHGIVRQQLLNAALVGLYHLGASPATLARWYRHGQH